MMRPLLHGLAAQARDILRNTSAGLIRDWKDEHAGNARDTATGIDADTADGTATVTKSVTANGHAANGAAAPKSGKATGIKPGSFLELFLSERERSKEPKLNDTQVGCSYVSN